MLFMGPEIHEDAPYYVETNEGGWIVPSFVCGTLDIGEGLSRDDDEIRFDDAAEAVRPYVGGRDILSIERLPSGFIGKLSAPGYMDCTEWQYAETEEEIRDDLGEEEDSD